MNQLSQYLSRENMTQVVFADRLGVKQSFISRLVRGVARPSLDMAFEIERVTQGAVPVSAWASAASSPDVVDE